VSSSRLRNTPREGTDAEARLLFRCPIASFSIRGGQTTEQDTKEDDERVRNKIKEMVTNEWRELTDYDVKPVQGCSHDVYRTRIGGYRVFFVVEKPIAAILHLDKREGAHGSTGKLEGRADDFFDP